MGTDLSPQQGGTATPLLFGPCVLWPNRCMDQDATCQEGRPQPMRLCVRWVLSPPSHKGGGAPSPIFGPFLFLFSRGLCVRWGPSPPPLLKKEAWTEVYHPPTPKIKGTAVESVADTILSDSIPDEPPIVTGRVCVCDNNKARSR